jgi:hypothetical protein
MAITRFPDSPRNGCWGDRPYAIIDWAGPASYVQVVTAAANNATGLTPTGGQAITNAAFGLSAPLEGIIAVGNSLSGTYIVQMFQTTSYQQGQGNGTWIVQWITAATGAEVGAATALNNETVRLIAFGPY